MKNKLLAAVLFSISTYSSAYEQPSSYSINNKLALDLIDMSPRSIVVYTTPKYSEYLRDIDLLQKKMFVKNLDQESEDSYKKMRVLANKDRSLAMYYTGLYMMKYQKDFGFDQVQAIALVKKAADLGEPLAQELIGTLYQDKTTSILNDLNLSESEYASQQKSLKEIGESFTIKAARNGLEKSYLRVCNLLLTGTENIRQDVKKSANCYSNEIQVFNTPIAYGLLASLYLEAPEFRNKDSETKGRLVAFNGTQLGDTLSMTVLGQNFIHPKFLDSDILKGKELIDFAIKNGHK